MELHKLNEETLQFNSIVKRGAGLEKHCSVAEKELLKSKEDVLFLYGGVCDITDLRYDHHGNRSVVLPMNMEARLSIHDKMDEIASKFMLIGCNTYLSFNMEAGLDLIA